MENNIEQQSATNNNQFAQGEFSSVQQELNDFSSQQPTEEKPELKDKKKNPIKIIILVISIIAIAFIALVIVEKITGKTFLFHHNGQEEEIKVNTGTDWGNRYLTYMLKNKSELTNYEISFIDFDNDHTPEMLLKYTDANTKSVTYIL